MGKPPSQALPPGTFQLPLGLMAFKLSRLLVCCMVLTKSASFVAPTLINYVKYMHLDKIFPPCAEQLDGMIHLLLNNAAGAALAAVFLLQLVPALLFMPCALPGLRLGEHEAMSHDVVEVARSLVVPCSCLVPILLAWPMQLYFQRQGHWMMAVWMTLALLLPPLLLLLAMHGRWVHWVGGFTILQKTSFLVLVATIV